MIPAYLVITAILAVVLLFLISQTELPKKVARVLRFSVAGAVALAILFHMFSPLASRGSVIPTLRSPTNQAEPIRFSDGKPLTRRGYYASQILAAMLASPIIRNPASTQPQAVEDASRRAVEYADALIAALGE